jgi:hypothetical protein
MDGETVRVDLRTHHQVALGTVSKDNAHGS